MKPGRLSTAAQAVLATAGAPRSRVAGVGWSGP